MLAKTAEITYEIAIVEGDALPAPAPRAIESTGIRMPGQLPSRSRRIRLEVSQRPPPRACIRA